MVMLTGIFSREREKDDAIDRYFERDYHQAGDELEAVPSFDGAAEDVEAALAVVRWMANADVPPRWLPNSPYQRGGGPSRSEERRCAKECVSKCRSRCAPDH